MEVQKKMDKKLNRKGVFGLSNQVLQYAVVIIILSVAATILTSLGSTQTAGSAALNATNNGLSGVNNFSGQMPLLATILVFVAIISAVVFLANAFRAR